MQFRWLAVLGAVSLFGAASPASCRKRRLRPLSRFPFYWQLRTSRRHKSQNFVGALQINNDTDIVAGNAFISAIVGNHYRYVQISRLHIAIASITICEIRTGARIREQSRDA